MKIRVLLQTETVPDPTPEDDTSPAPVEDQVRDALECIESGYNSEKEWRMIRKLYQALVKMPRKSPRVQNLINMILPVVSRYGYHDTVGTDPRR